jgi:hypothetical protein
MSARIEPISNIVTTRMISMTSPATNAGGETAVELNNATKVPINPRVGSE